MGYAELSQKGTGLRQRIYSRAFIVGDTENPSDRILYLVLDLQSGDTAVRDGILKGLAGMGPEYSMYTKDNLAVTGTHSHSGPGGWTNYFLHHASTLGFERNTYNAVVTGALTSIKRAHASLKEGKLDVGKIRVDKANINRSLFSYNANPEAERQRYADNVDKDLTLLRFADLNNKPFGVLTFFATHGTSMLRNNTLVSGDNKGVAASLFEKQMRAESPGFVAGFSQANVGDVSPNVEGAYCETGPDAGKECKLADSTCGGKTGPCQARGPYWGMKDGGAKSCFEIGKRQYEKAYELLQQMNSGQGKFISGPVRSFHTYQDMTKLAFTHPNGNNVTTCPSALGYSFAAGTSDGAGVGDLTQGLKGPQPAVSPIWPILSGIIKTASAENKACQGIKPILLDVGESTFPYLWAPNVVDIQMLRVGSLIIVVSAGEASTMAGRRWRNAIQKAVIDQQIVSEEPIVLLGGPANSYIHYVTTEEEYSIQRYEGASTLYGPNTLNGMIYSYSRNIQRLSTDKSNTPIDPGPQPPINIEHAISLTLPTPPDFAPIGKSFGNVLSPPKSSYKKGEVLTVTFVGASPRNNFRNEGTFVAVQKQDATGQWITVLDDSDWELIFEYKKTGVLSTTSESKVTWEIGADTAPAQYRVVYNGDSKPVIGAISAFRGISPTFSIS
jgi:neutral ceramidase